MLRHKIRANFNEDFVGLPFLRVEIEGGPSLSLE